MERRRTPLSRGRKCGVRFHGIDDWLGMSKRMPISSAGVWAFPQTAPFESVPGFTGIQWKFDYGIDPHFWPRDGLEGKGYLLRCQRLWLRKAVSEICTSPRLLAPNREVSDTVIHRVISFCIKVLQI
jgi:hypothetical protein